MNHLARTAFWTLTICAYTLAIWCTIAVLSGVRLLPFDNAGYIVFGGWTKDALFTQAMCWITSIALLPFVIYFQRSLRYVVAGLGVWCFHILWFFVFAVY